MKEKIYSLYSSAIDKKGLKHEIVMVGIYNQVKSDEVVTRKVLVPVKENKNITGTLTFSKPEIKRNLKYAFAICHPTDVFNKEQGKKLAIKRARKNPMGEMETKLITTLCKDQIKHILKGEMNYVVKNIDKFIEN